MKKWNFMQISKRSIHTLLTSRSPDFQPSLRSMTSVFVLIGYLIGCSSLVNAQTTQTQGQDDKPFIYPTIDYKSQENPELVKKGEYLTKMGDCIACHTDKDGKQPFAGGLPVETPFGTIYSSNITPDEKTGIGRWTQTEFIKAMKHGISPSGSYYFPVFPYPNFNRLSDEDVIAIKAYLDALPPIKKENQEPDMPFPFRWRAMQFFWRTLFFTPYEGEFKKDPNKSEVWNRGAYIAEGLGHCGMCHTPINFLGASKRKYHLSGGFVENFYAPEINENRLKNTPIEKITNVFKHNQRLEGDGKVMGPMQQVNQDSLIYLTDEDLNAIATYLKTAKGKPIPRPTSSNEISLKVGQKIYETYCTGCHMSGAGGAPKTGDTAAWAPLIASGIENLHKNALNGINSMPRKGGCSTCTDNEIISAVNYIVEESKESAGKPQGPKKTPSPPPDTSLTKGKEVYDTYCSACHESGKYHAPITGDKAVWGTIIPKGMDVLLERAIKTYRDFPGFKGSDASIIAAVKYMIEQSKTSGNYLLW